MGILRTPKHLQLGVTDDIAYEDSYNYERQLYPWEGTNIIGPNNLMFFEDTLLVGFPPFTLVDPIV